MGKTLNKLNYLKETKSQIKTALNQFGAGITNDTFRSYVSKISSIYDNWTKVTDENSQLNLTPTRKGKMILKLNSTELTQDGTPSPSSPIDVNVIKGDNNIVVQNKNLLNFTFTNPIEKNGITFTKNNNGSLTLNGTATTTFTQIFNITSKTLKGTYTIKHNVLGGTTSENSYMSIQKSPSGNISDRVYGGTGSNTYNITEDTTIITASLYITSGTTFTDYNVGSQLEQGSTATDFIEHQEQNYKISLSSKNLANYLDIPNAPQWGSYYGSKYIEITGLKPNTQYTMSSNVPYNSNGQIYFNGGTLSNRVYLNNNCTQTSDGNGVLFFACFTNRDYYNDIINGTYYIQLEEGTEATTYEPYYNIEYCKIGDYADQIFKNTTDSPYYDNTLIENEWYLKKNIGKVVLDGSETGWDMSVTSRFYLNIGKLLQSTTGFCNRFNAQALGNTNGITFLYNSENIYIQYNEKTNVTDFKTWLSTNNVIVDYVLATPTYIQLSQEDYPTLRGQLENIYNNSKSYNGQTNITQTNDDLPFNINASALMKGDE